MVGDMLDTTMKIIDYTWVDDIAYCKVVLLHDQQNEQISFDLDEVDIGDFNIEKELAHSNKFDDKKHIKLGNKIELEAKKKEEAEEKARKAAGKREQKIEKDRLRKAEEERKALEDANPIEAGEEF